MIYLVSFFMVGLVLGLVAVASNPSPYYAALGLVMAAGAGCCVIVNFGASFLSLVLFLIYLGGMLVVFAYSAALTAEPYPEAWGSWSVVGYVLVYLLLVMGGCYMVGGLTFSELLFGDEMAVVRGDLVGVSLMYSSGGLMLVVGGWILLLTLFVVLELTRGHYRGGLRAV
uniref:NADH-ubiquinone oxidoreductase chain 6 n=1 Tax=Bombina lichuanensis TaxID=414352 RepID=R9QPU1_9ANUR|nr:NADH dehydrogenase subunit 6 [Bombina lichuanensis]AFV95273.1 NADH dehydrogenase subunit 6 [Bombina lichuanensis]